ncbi:hypothetical protein P4O66_003219 [Electrophorus voltai]|uniref:Reverse transcriptase/retrotransposon-derived protein RNase H-like domain-containing protein n=1 Tax=Electrophorus voltai TaxID=2609070 RepID=A0AAD8YTV5_9TELE|nr:hypothetical protein P4O66_003219 [Electrophorus voltai]
MRAFSLFLTPAHFPQGLFLASHPLFSLRISLGQLRSGVRSNLRFIKNFSTVAAPLTMLTRKASGQFCWSTEAQQAFEELKHHLITAPILQLPDAELPFTVEVDTSEVSVGAVLSQRSKEDKKLHPCAYFSWRLSPAERKYDMGNRELLAVKLALEEWRHWLEGAKHTFLVWTYHKNLSYVQQTNRLNPYQARWGLFFAQFDFIILARH